MLQEFIVNKGPLENYSSSLFNVEDIHRIAILDLRILNLDRNLCNILVTTKNPSCQIDNCTESSSTENKQSCWMLVPIDHGLSIPDTLEINQYELAWLSFEQATLPFSKQSLEYIDSINVDFDIKLLEENLYFRPECLRNLRISSMLLK